MREWFPQREPKPRGHRTIILVIVSDIKLGILTDEIDDEVLTAAKFLGQYALKWAEIRNIWNQYNTEQPIEKVRKARGILGHVCFTPESRHSLRIHELGRRMNGGATAPAVFFMPRSVSSAASRGCPCCR